MRLGFAMNMDWESISGRTFAPAAAAVPGCSARVGEQVQANKAEREMKAACACGLVALVEAMGIRGGLKRRRAAGEEFYLISRNSEAGERNYLFACI
jgi:hypothetical protein